MLTGFAIAPALLIGGITLSIQGQKAWTQALEHEADVDVACEQMQARAELFDQLRTRMDELRSVLDAVDTRAMASLARLQELDFDPDQHAAQFQETALSRKVSSGVADYDLEALARGMGVDFLALSSNNGISGVVEEAAAIAATGRPVLVEVEIDYSEKTFFTRGVVKTNLLRLPLKDQMRFVGRAVKRKVTG